MAGQSFKVCKNQTYALCAAARCNVFDGVAYCQCDVKHGDSISLQPLQKSLPQRRACPRCDDPFQSGFG
jgi:hypothetical protein